MIFLKNINWFSPWSDPIKKNSSHLRSHWITNWRKKPPPTRLAINTPSFCFCLFFFVSYLLVTWHITYTSKSRRHSDTTTPKKGDFLNSDDSPSFACGRYKYTKVKEALSLSLVSFDRHSGRKIAKKGHFAPTPCIKLFFF
jgi:hypothetical protein